MRRVKTAFVRVLGFILLYFWVGTSFAQALSPEVAKLRASELKSGYAIRLLQPIPRHNNGCDTVFRNGKVLESCDGNFGMDPTRYGGILMFCRWNLHTVYTGDESQEWTTPFNTSQTIPISGASDVWKVNRDHQTIYGRIRNMEAIKDRHVQIRFGHPDLGELNCYPGYPQQIRKNSDYYFGASYFYWGRKDNDEAYSGLSIEDIQRQLRSFIEIVTIR